MSISNIGYSAPVIPASIILKAGRIERGKREDWIQKRYLDEMKRLEILKLEVSKLRASTKKDIKMSDVIDSLKSQSNLVLDELLEKASHGPLTKPHLFRDPQEEVYGNEDELLRIRDKREFVPNSTYSDLLKKTQENYIEMSNVIVDLEKEKLTSILIDPKKGVKKDVSQPCSALEESKTLIPFKEFSNILAEILEMTPEEYIAQKELEIKTRKVKFIEESNKYPDEIKDYLQTIKGEKEREETRIAIETIAQKFGKNSEGQYSDIYSEKNLEVDTSDSENFGSQINSKNKLVNSMVSYLHEKNHPTVLDIGPGYGVNTRQFLEAGANVLAMDLDANNLAVLVDNTKEQDLDRLQVSLGSFPNDATKVMTASQDAILLSHVAHYYTPEEEEKAFLKMNSLLKNDGTLFFQSLTPHAGPYTLTTREETAYNKLKKFKQTLQSNHKDLDSEVTKRWPTFLGDDRLAYHPQHRFVLEYNLPRLGFQIKQAEHFGFTDGSNWKLPKSGSSRPDQNNNVSDKSSVVGIIATKENN